MTDASVFIKACHSADVHAFCFTHYTVEVINIILPLKIHKQIAKIIILL